MPAQNRISFPSNTRMSLDRVKLVEVNPGDWQEVYLPPALYEKTQIDVAITPINIVNAGDPFINGVVLDISYRGTLLLTYSVNNQTGEMAGFEGSQPWNTDGNGTNAVGMYDEINNWLLQ